MTKLFGTDGIRSVAGEFPLDRPGIYRLGRSLATRLAEILNRSPRFIIGRDTRQSGQWIESVIAAGIVARGGEVSSAGIITTPGVAYVTRAGSFDAGIVISASHNPYQDNGIKVFSPTGQKLSDEMEQRIEEDLLAGGAAAEDVGELPLVPDSRFVEEYINYLSKTIGMGLDLSHLTIALDCANGAAWQIAPRLFESLGARVQRIACQPDGTNINADCGALYPSGLQRFVQQVGADLGVAFDGDCDRSIFVDDTGRLIDGDFVMYLLARLMKEQGKLASNLVVATVMSNVGLELALNSIGIDLLRAPVGDRFVLEELLKTGAKIGGEQSGHIIFPDISLAGDGLLTALQVLRAMVESGQSLRDLTAGMKKYPQVLVNVPVASKPPLDSFPEIKAEIDFVESRLRGTGRLLLRYSGTEDLARVMIEGQDEGEIEQLAARLATVIREKLGLKRQA